MAAAGLLSWLAAAPVAAAEEPAAPAVAARAPTRHAAARPGAPALDRRVALLAAELQLTPAQQAEVRALLQRQREDLQQLWADASVPAAVRIGRTQAISDHTADGIRALLDEAQRQKYQLAHQRQAPVGASGADLEAWMAQGARP